MDYSAIQKYFRTHEEQRLKAQELLIEWDYLEESFTEEDFIVAFCEYVENFFCTTIQSTFNIDSDSVKDFIKK